MKKFTTRIFALALSAAMALGVTSTALAATVPSATIDTSKTGSIDIYKYDLTMAETDSDVKEVLDAYVSTGVRDTELEALLDDGTTNKLGNGQDSYGYAIKGVEFSYLKVADIVQYDETEADGTHKDMVLYKFEDAKDAALLTALGLSNANAYAVTDEYAVEGYHFFMSDTLVTALRTALATNSTTVKNALEAYMTAQSASRFTETDAHGHTKVENLALGLYLIVETKVPEMVTSTTDPFFVSVPMTSVNGGANGTAVTNGGQEWLYNLTIYPKNVTGIPSLEKTVRESKSDTGKNNGSTTDITDGYLHNATASDGDKLEYQIISKLPAITSEATALTTYTFVDSLSKGIEYNGNSADQTMLKGNYNAKDVKVEWFKDAACTELITTWTLNDATAKYTVTYGTGESDATTMTIAMTADGLNEINHAATVYTAASATDKGYSSCYIRITYSATVNQNADVVYGDDGNSNTVVLTWKRSNTNYYDTLVDDCHVYTYVLDLTKQFSDNNGNFANVNFKLFNKTDGYWVVAEKASDGVYYVKGADKPAGWVAGASDDDVTTSVVSETDEDGSKGTTFVPSSTGKLFIYGLEDDEYILTETQTDNGYTLLKDNINIVITVADDDTRPCGIYATDVLGLVQNDERYETFDGYQELAHNMLTASATVDGDDVTMKNSGDSTNAIVPLTVINTRGFDLPQTGSEGTWLLSIAGVLGMAAAAFVIVFVAKKKKEDEAEG